MNASRCLLCGSGDKLADAHIIPRAFYPREALRSNTPQEAIRAYSANERREPRRPKGIYDKSILCAECDRRIGQFDDYAARILRPLPKRQDLLRDTDGFIMRGRGTRYRGYWVRSPDVALLQCFAASLLWRAAVTSRPEASLKVDYLLRDRARRVFEHDDKASYFDLLLMRLWPGDLSRFVARPVEMQEPYSPGFRFCMNGIVLTILAARLETPAPALVLGREPDWLAAFVPFWGSKYEEAFRDILRVRGDAV